MKYYHWLVYAASIAAAYGLGWLVEWANSPLAKPLCFASGREALREAISMSYQAFWAVALAIAALPFLAVLLWIATSLHRMARR